MIARGGVAVRRRIWLLAAAFTALWLVQVAQLWRWQVREAPVLARRAAAQRMRALQLAPRGLVLDRLGRPLTDPQPRWDVAVFPALAGSPDEVARALARATGEPAPVWAGRLRAHAGAGPYWAGAELTAGPARAVAAAEIPGVAAVPRPVRYGPGALARHVIGYVNQAGGQLGLEAAFDAELRGDAGPHVAAFVDGSGRPLEGLGVRAVDVPAGKPPLSIRLTLDGRAQAAVERILDGWSPPGPGAPLRAAVVVLDPRSGDILAMASRPQFDPLRPPVGPGAPGAAWAPLVNRAVAPYPPGSVFKPVVAAAALETGAVAPGEPFECSGSYTIGGQTFTDPRPGGHGRITLAGALAQSCNITFIRIGYERLGTDRMLATARRFGFGAPVGIGLREEAGGFLPAPRYGGEVAQLAFGQGLLVTPLQVARAYAALVRDGLLPPVGLVDAVLGPDGTPLRRGPRAPAVPALAPEVARQIARDLEGVTDPDGTGTGRNAWVPGWGSAGKTGSAEVVTPDGLVVHSWFAGWTPLRDPRLVIAVLIEEGGAGGQGAARLFREVAQALLDAGGPRPARGRAP